MPDFRSAANLNSIPMSGLIGSGAAVNTYYSTLTTSKVSFTTKTTLVGTSVSVVVPGASSTIIAVASYVMGSGSSSSNSTTGTFNWNSTDQTAVCTLTTAAGAAAVIVPGQQTYVITGISAGTYTALLEGTCTQSGTGNGFYSASLSILVIGNS